MFVCFDCCLLRTIMGRLASCSIPKFVYICMMIVAFGASCHDMHVNDQFSLAVERVVKKGPHPRPLERVVDGVDAACPVVPHSATRVSGS